MAQVPKYGFSVLEYLYLFYGLKLSIIYYRPLLFSGWSETEE